MTTTQCHCSIGLLYWLESWLDDLTWKKQWLNWWREYFDLIWLVTRARVTCNNTGAYILSTWTSIRKVRFYDVREVLKGIVVAAPLSVPACRFWIAENEWQMVATFTLFPPMSDAPPVRSRSLAHYSHDSRRWEDRWMQPSQGWWVTNRVFDRIIPTRWMNINCLDLCPFPDTAPSQQAVVRNPGHQLWGNKRRRGLLSLRWGTVSPCCQIASQTGSCHPVSVVVLRMERFQAHRADRKHAYYCLHIFLQSITTMTITIEILLYSA